MQNIYNGKYISVIKTKYAGKDSINITLMFRNFLIKTIDNSYSNSELYLNFKI